MTSNEGGLFADANYRAWFVADTSAVTTGSLRNFSIPLLAFAITGSVVYASALATVTAIVQLLASLLGGVIVDRNDRRRLILLYAAIGSVIWGTASILYLAGGLTYSLLLLAQIAAALNAGFLGAAPDAALRSVVPTQVYPRAIAATQGRDATVTLASGPAGGLLYSLSPVLPLLGSIVGYTLMVLGLTRVKTDLAPPAYERSSWLADIAAGFRYVFSRRRLRAILVMLMVANFGGNVVLQCINLWLIRRGTHPVLIGALDAAAGAAMLFGAVLAGRLVQRIPTGRLVAIGLTWSAVAVGAGVLGGTYWSVLVGLVVGVIPLPVLESALAGFFFATAPTQIQGRLHSVIDFFASALLTIGPVLAGIGLVVLGFEATSLIAVGLLALSALIGAVHPALRTIPKPDLWESVSAADV